MKSLAITVALMAALVGSAAPVFARDALDRIATTTVKLQDGSTLYIFKDGKMAKEDAYGRAVTLKPGEVLTAKDGRQIKAVGNESARLDGLLNDGHRG
ncbi:MAG: CopK family periplasmic copper-binding protein [Burkholderiaceae bacterium]|nr:CopK family periplasmic copper-binding protein [Burkholderiaceae bacterium]